jgi:hypothetical protein
MVPRAHRRGRRTVPASVQDPLILVKRSVIPDWVSADAKPCRTWLRRLPPVR